MAIKRKVSRQVKWQREQVANGKCRLCGDKRSKKSNLYCPYHHRADNEKSRRYYRKMRAAYRLVRNQTVDVDNNPCSTTGTNGLLPTQ